MLRGSEAKKARQYTHWEASSLESAIVSRANIVKIRFGKGLELKDMLLTGHRESSLEVKCVALYPIYNHTFVNSGKPVGQVTVAAPSWYQSTEDACLLIVGDYVRP